MKKRIVHMSHFKDETVVLAGDIGGTKTNVGVFLQGKERPLPKVIETYSSREAPDLENIIGHFLPNTPCPSRAPALVLPVPWSMDDAKLLTFLGRCLRFE